MSDSTARDARARREAARWHTRLSRLSVTTDALREFRAWKQDDANAQAYAHVEATWDAAGRLAGDPEIARLTEAALARRPRPDLRRRRVRLAGAGVLAATALGAMTVGGWYLAAWRNTYATGVGEQRLLVLDDGSRVRLNTDSRIRVRFRRAARDVDLVRGEAFFEVAHNAARPFVVHADGAQVRALGTRFDVRRDPAAVRVTLLEGQVRVTDGTAGPARTLAPGQQVTASRGGLSPPAPANAGAETAWTAGRLEFHDARLADAVAEVNRYSERKIVLDGPPALADRRVSGVFDTGDSPAFVAAVRTLFGLRTARGADGAIRLSPAAPPPPRPA
jgi:transmembrane sensor